MPRLAKLQIIGPATLFAVLLAAESAVYALGSYPSSQALWSINLQLFGIFQKSHYVLSSYISIAYFQFFFIGLPLFLIACGGLIFKCRFVLAIASSLSFVYVSFLLCAWYICDQSWHQASFIVTGISAGPDIYLVSALLGASLLSFVVSHMSYLRACKADGDGVQFLCFRAGLDHGRGRPVLRGTQ
jgi:hypothetical protein